MYTESKEVMKHKSTINRAAKFMLTLLGIWPDISYVMFYRMFWTVTMLTFLFYHYLYFLAHYHSNDVFDLMDCFSSFLGYSKIIMYFVFFWFNQRIFDEILTMMAEDWNDCTESDIEMHETVNKAKMSNHITNVIMTLHVISPVLYGMNIILANVDITDHTVELPHIFKMEIPFNINTQCTYKVVLIVELIHLVMCSLSLGVINVLLLILTLHIGGQLNILHRWLAKMIFKENKHKSIAIIMKKIIRKHQKIIYFAKNVENLYTFIAFMQFISNTIMICIIGFLIVTALGNSNATEKIVRMIPYYSITNLEAFIFCYAGEYLINKSKTIGLVAYNIAWYELEPKYSRSLLFIMLRAQKHLTLTVGKMKNLSLQCFASIINSAGSYLSVLLAMQ
ncbi:odorant receptor 4-like isoform X1 [Camponotus floridanus]|uniref:odorant receptor 4-like isoform X1 n=1 Tax=Camponotus floridanus TaxID=104421 RepID=UPI000DC664C4|nr:odorant receptor 4-like isoform X1 [Camponotus floridanus]